MIKEKDIVHKKDEELFSKMWSPHFSKLSSNIVVNHILPFYKFTPNNTFSQHGFFKKSKTREIIPIWKSIILYADFEPEHLIDISNINHLILDHFKYTDHGAVFTGNKSCNNLKNLKSLEIYQSPTFSDEFFQKCKFENLQRLHVKNCSKIRGKKWKCENLSNVKELWFLDTYNLEEDLFQSCALEKCEELILRNTPKLTGMKWNKEIFKKISTLILCQVEKFSNEFFSENFSNLKKLDLIDLPLISSEKLNVKNFQYLSHFSVVKCNFGDNFFKTVKFKNLQQLKLKSLQDITGVGWRDVNVVNLDTLIINSCNKIKNDFFSCYKMPKLTSIDLFNMEHITGVGWDKSLYKTIQKISLYKCKKFDEDGFNFKNLSHTILGFAAMFKFCDRRWEESFKNLKSLQLDGCVHLENCFFDRNNFSNLQTLLLLDEPKISGHKWLPLPKLEHLEINRCVNIGDLFFTSNNFPRLKYLSLENLILATSKGWNKFPLLETLVVKKCMNFNDNIFQTHYFPHLLSLSIHGCNKITGGKWHPMVGLKMITVFFCEKFLDSTFRHNNFPHLVKINLAKVAKVEQDDWRWRLDGQLKSLKKLFIDGKYIKNFDKYKKPMVV